MSRAALVTLDVYPDEGESYEADLDSKLLLLWERTHGGSSLDLLEEPSIATMYQLAHFEAQTRRGYAGDLSSFEEGHALNVRPESQAPDPTRTAPSTD